MLQYLRRTSCGCHRRPAAKAPSAPNVCPISGQTSATGVCPISGQSTAVTSPTKTDSRADASPAKAAPEAQQAAEEPVDVVKARDPLLGASSEADAEVAAELKEKGNALFKKQEFEQALQIYNEAILLQPKDGSIWLNRSIVNRQLKNWADGEQDAEVACELQPHNPKAHYSRAMCLKEMGRLARALDCCEKGLEVQPDNKALQQLQITIRHDLGVREHNAAKPKKAFVETPAKQVDETQCPVSRLAEDSKAEANAISEAYQWKDRMPSEEERNGLKTMMTNMFKDKYQELREQANKAKASAPTEQYEKEQKLGLQLKGGHQPMKRPEHVELPESFKKPLGVISLEELTTYGIDNPERRYLISVYGECFDVSDRPDKYGPDGPYNSLTGRDITWGLAAGVDTPDYCNKCYDLFKAKDMGKDKIAGVCSWLAWYHTEYGEPVAKLEPFLRESSLPAPPLQEMDEACCVM